MIQTEHVRGKKRSIEFDVINMDFNMPGMGGFKCLCDLSGFDPLVKMLGDLFDELDYPIDIEGRFAFNWRFVIIGVPDGSSKILSPEVYEREKQKFIETMDEARELAIQSLREEFAGLVERICDRFGTGPDGKPKIFKNSTVDSFYRYFETFRSRNIFDDDQLSELVAQAQSLLQDASTDSVRSNDVLKQRIKTGMEGFETAMGEVFERPRRQISI